MSLLNQEPELARQLLEQLAVAVWVVDDAQRVTYMSRRGLAALGRNAESVIGQPVERVFPKGTVPVVLEVHRNALAGEESEQDVRFGELMWSVASAPLRDRSGAIARTMGRALDVTEARAEEDQLRLITYGLDHSPDCAYLLGQDGRMRYVNDAASRSLGYAREELLTMTIPDIDPDFPPERWASFWEDLREQGQMYISTRHRRKDGGTHPVEVVAYYFVFHGVEYDFAFSRDVSERVRAAEERAQLEERIRQAQKMESLGILAGGIAHDFNNLLVPILANAQIALRTMPVDAAARPRCEAIEIAARRAAELCGQMLAYSGRGNFVISHLDVNNLVGEMAQVLELAVAANVAIKTDLDDDLPAIDADATQIRQVVMNLITNASDAIGDAGGEITVSTGMTHCTREDLATVHLGEDLSEGDYVYIEVADDGAGMSESALGRLFDPFFTTKFTGRGLGLAVVLGIVRGHGGAIRVRSQEGSGTAMRVLLRRASTQAEPQTERPSIEEGWHGEGTLLLVDDDDAVRTATKAMIELLGFEVVTAVSGNDALSLWPTISDRVVCVVLDLTMPDGDGETCYRALKKDRPDVPVVLCSGYHEQEATGRFVGQGLAGFLQKPYDFADLERALQQALKA